MKNTPDKKKSRIRKPIIIVSSIVGFFLLLAVAAVGILIHYIHKMNYVPLNENYTILAETESFEEDVTNPEEETSSDSSQEEIDEYKLLAQQALENVKDDYEPIGDVYNVLLIGSDTRVANGEGRSDTMMLISINKTEKKIVATSFLRDLYVNIPGKGFYKINAAYAYGGVELLIDTIQYNFSLEIDRYIAVDFYSFIEIVDILGGLDVDVQEDELYWLNQYIHASNLLLGEYEHDGYLDYADGSYQHLSGKQALAYSRFRYVGNGDFTRTERQRKVVNLLFDKLKGISPSTLIELLDTILPQVTTNIPTGEFLELIAILPEMGRYDIISWGVPDGQFKYITINGESCIGIDFNYYIDRIYKLIYSSDDDVSAQS